MLVLSSCGGGAGSDVTSNQPSRTAANGEVFNAADVAFASSVIVHDSESLAIVDLTVGRPLRPKVERLVIKLRDRRTPEIETMTSWLIAWDEPIPPTIRDHVNAHGDRSDGGDEPSGSLSTGDLRRVKKSSDADFEQRFLALLLAHEPGAIEIAEAETKAGVYLPATDVAAAIQDSQNRLIADLEALTG
jgi:uncharacterized protein (DUF305 family)